MNVGQSASTNNINIRLTSERWLHITYSHKEINPDKPELVLETIENPDAVLQGDKEEKLAVKQISSRKWLVVIYKEEKPTGFVITAYITTDNKWLFRRKIIWSKV